VPGDLEAVAEAPQGPDEHRPEGQAEDDVADDEREVERQPAAGEQDELGQRVAAVGHPQREVEERAEREARGAARGGERPAAEVAPGDARQAGADEARGPEADHLPRRVGPLAEEEVRGECRDGADREARRGART
jgi:hypothetical protein